MHPVNNALMNKSGQSWMPACLGDSARPAFASAPAPLNGVGKRYGGAAWMHESDMVEGRFGDLALRLRDLRDEQRIQDEQGGSVFAHNGEANLPQAPATAHTAAASLRSGASGPYPWRPPV